MTTQARTPHRPAALLAAALVLAAAAGAASAGEFRKAPPLKLPGLDGKPLEVAYDAGRVTLVNFWATWCAPCKEEMPQIDRLHAKYRDRGFRAVGVALQSGEPAEVREFIVSRKLQVGYPILIGTDELAEAYGSIEIVPTTYLIGPDGAVLKSWFGMTTDFETILAREIEKHLAAPPPRKG